MTSLPDILERIVAHKKLELAEGDRHEPVQALQQRCIGVQRNGAQFVTNLTQPGLQIIAEIKRRSPSAGTIAALPDPQEQARAYDRGGAAAISVLTDSKFFGGSLQDLEAVRHVTNLPLLRKDFVISERQVYEAALSGADLILLIAAILSPTQAGELTALAKQLGMTVLFEIHSLAEFQPFSSQSWPVIGINNRNLRTFVTDRKTTLELRSQLPRHALVVSESGFATARDFVPFVGLVDGFLVGEALSGSVDAAATLQAWRVYRDGLEKTT